MKAIEDRIQLELVINHPHQNRAGVFDQGLPVSWGDNFPVVRLGSEVGFVDTFGAVHESIEEAFVTNHHGCLCLKNPSSTKVAINRMALFLALVALEAPPSKIGELMFQGDMFMFETFSDMMERRKLVEHLQGDPVEGYEPLGLTNEGKAGLRMCLESEMVDLPFDVAQEVSDQPKVLEDKKAVYVIQGTNIEFPRLPAGA